MLLCHFKFSFKEDKLNFRFIGTLKGNCHELRMHLSKVVCGNMPGFLATFRSRNLLFCLELSLSPPKARHMRAAFPCIDAALNQTWKNQAVIFKLTAHDSFPLRRVLSKLAFEMFPPLSLIPSSLFKHVNKLTQHLEDFVTMKQLTGEENSERFAYRIRNNSLAGLY